MAQQTATTRELRKFGLTVGIAFLVLGSISWWRGHEWAPRALWSAGALLVAPALVAPATLGPVRRAWMAFAEVVGAFNTRLILGLLFYLVFTPVGLVMRLFRDPLSRSLRGRESTYWVRRKPEPVDPARYQQQF
jgi:multisubunit Na+/H+ antiporter MnhG subunit